MNSQKERFEAIFGLASALPWSSPEKLYIGLSRILLEHLLMTSIAESLSTGNSEESREIKVRTLRRVQNAAEQSGYSLVTAHDLVDLYVDALMDPGGAAPVVSTGSECAWILGCPAVAKPSNHLPTGIRAFCSLEDDHVFPKARTKV